jgi:rhamnosyltransferase
MRRSLKFMARPHVGIVLFHPQAEQLEKTLSAVLAEAGHVFLFLNAPLDPEAECCVGRHAGPRLSLLGDGTNLGLGVAYNRIVAEARSRNAETVLLLDQDSSPPGGMIQELLALLLQLRNAGVLVAAVGPRPLAAPGSKTKTPRIFPRAVTSPVPEAAPVEFLISSGTLLDLDTLAIIGGFREDFFIDAIDIEWCFRASASGFSCWMARDIVMPHQLGRGFIRVPVIGILLTVQPSFRAYAYARNQGAMLSLRHVPLRWKLKFLFHLMLQALVNGVMQRQGGVGSWVFVRGLLDGLRGHLGPLRP